MKIKEIIIDRWEGPVEMCDMEKKFSTWEAANNWLQSQSHSFPKGGCYDKHGFKVTWEDGEEYEGRLDCKHFTETDNDLNLKQHIIDHCIWHAGKKVNPWCGKEKYEQMMADWERYKPGTKQSYIDFLNKYFPEVGI